MSERATPERKNSGLDEASFPSPPDVFGAAQRVLQSLGFSEFMRLEFGVVEFCREGDEATAETIILQDNPWYEWESVRLQVARSSCLDLEAFDARAREVLPEVDN